MEFRNCPGNKDSLKKIVIKRCFTGTIIYRYIFSFPLVSQLILLSASPINFKRLSF